MRPSQIIRSEKQVKSVVRVLEEEYLNQFSVTLDKSNLYNLSSGVAIENEEVVREILNINAKGRELLQEFIDSRYKSNYKAFHDPIPKCNVKLFKNLTKKITVAKGKQTHVAEVNRNILAKLTSLSARTGKVVNFEDALKYPLSSVPLSISFPDGSKRNTEKSNIMDFLELPEPSCTTLPTTTTDYIIDVMAQIRSVTQIPSTFEELTLEVFKIHPKEYQQCPLSSRFLFSRQYQRIRTYHTRRRK